MKLPNKITFLGHTFKRPTKNYHRCWKQPERELGYDDYRIRYSKHTNDTGLYDYSECSRTDEGYSSWGFVVDFDSGTASVESDGSDCDGRMQHFAEYEYINGEWVEESASQRDHTAEAMGY